ncbi:PrgH/EprH family type III secretion apparatus protein [Escherichia coli]
MEKVIDNIAKLRILNTAMNGCEFPLYEGRNLFVTKKDSSDENDNQPDLILPEDTVFLPSVNVDFNFEVIVNEQDSESTVLIRELREDKCNEYQIEFNTPFNVGQLKLILAKKNTAWSKEILGIDEKKNNEKETWVGYLNNWKAISLFAIFLGGVVIYFCLSDYLSPNHNSSKKVEEKVSSENHVKDYLAVVGTNNKTYVFTSNQEKASFLRRYKDKASDKESYIITTYKKEEERVRNIFYEKYPELILYKISFENVKQPNVIVSASHFSTIEKNKEEFSLIAKKIMPYITAIKLTPVDDDIIIDNARSGLEQLGLSYKIKKNDATVSFIVRMNIDDSLLYKFQNFVSSFYQSWGSSVIKFNLLLQDEDSQLYSGGSIGGVTFVKKGDNMWLLQ